MATATDRSNKVASVQEVFSFTLLLSGFDEITSELENALFEAGCDDALLGIQAGNPYLAFDRESTTLDDAIKTAIADVEKVQAAGHKIEVVRVIPPGEDTIEKFNVYLRTRRQVMCDTTYSPEIRDQIITVLTSLLNHNTQALKDLLK